MRDGIATSRIWLLQTGEPWPLRQSHRLMRTGKLAVELAKRGHDVTWWTSTFEHQRKVFVPGVTADTVIHGNAGYSLLPLQAKGYRRNVALRRYLDHQHVAARFARVAPSLPAPDLIVTAIPCHLLAYEASLFARARRIPYVVDIRDPWPDAIVNQLRQSMARLAGSLLLSRDRRRTAKTCAHAAGVVAVSNGYLRWAQTLGGRTESGSDRVFYLGYETVVDETAVQHPGVSEWRTRNPGRKLFVFSGTFGRSYEVMIVAAAARLLASRGRRDIGFILAGTGEQDVALRSEVQDLPSVCVPGWLEAPQLRTLLRAAYAGLIPCRSIVDTVPNKTFEYMAAGLPLLSSLEGEFEHLIAQRDLGISYRPGDVEALAQAIARLADDDGLHRRASAASRAFFLQHGDLDVITRQIAGHLEQVIA